MRKRVFLVLLLLICLCLTACGQYTSDFVAEVNGVTYTAIHRDVSNGFLETVEVDLTKDADADPAEKVYAYDISLPTSLYCDKCHEDVAISAFSGYRNSGTYAEGRVILTANWDVQADESFHLTLHVDKFNLPHGSDAINWSVMDQTGEWIDASRVSVSYVLAPDNSHVFLAADGEVYPHGQRFSVTIATPKIELYEELKQTYAYGETVTVKVKAPEDGKLIVSWNGEELEPTDKQEKYWSYEFKIIGAQNDITVEMPQPLPKEA